MRNRNSEEGWLAVLTGGAGCLIASLVGIVKLGFWVLVAWAIVKLVQHVTV